MSVIGTCSETALEILGWNAVSKHVPVVLTYYSIIYLFSTRAKLLELCFVFKSKKSIKEKKKKKQHCDT